MKPITITASVTTTNQEQAAKATEVIARTMAGLCLEGIPVFISISESEDQDQEATDG